MECPVVGISSTAGIVVSLLWSPSHSLAHAPPRKYRNVYVDTQEDLCGISDEIRHLQDQSANMNLELTNRREVQSKLQAFLDNVALPENMIKTICEGDINET